MVILLSPSGTKDWMMRMKDSEVTICAVFEEPVLTNKVMFIWIRHDNEEEAEDM